jgi:prenyltransferase beta subunit
MIKYFVSKKTFLTFLILILLLFLPSISVYSQTIPISNGLAWLASNQNSDGSWNENITSSYHSTATVIESLNYLSLKDLTYTNAINWVAPQQPANIRYISLKIISLAPSGTNISSDLNTLLSYQNSDGGFGENSENTSGISYTALSLLALKSANYTDSNTISSALGYLISTQNPDGGFGFYAGDDSNVYMTAMAAKTLMEYKTSYNLQASINYAVSYLLTKQNPDGGFGAPSSTVYETALVYQILVRTIYDPIAWAKAEGYLLNTQSLDGSWNQDAYSTALALRALYDAEHLRASQIQSVELYKSVNNQLQLSTTYDAFNRMVIKVNINDPNVRFDIQVRDSAGNIYNVSIINGEIIFDTGSYPPGTYTIIIRAIDSTTGIVVDEESITFTIQPTIAIPTLGISIAPVSTYVTAAQEIKLTAYITNQSNIQADIAITHEIKAPSNSIINTGNMNITLSPNEANKLITLTQFIYQFQEAGEHPVTVNIYRGAELLQTASTKIHVSPLVRIEPKKTLTPSTVAPDGDKRIRIEIELEGVEKP